MTNVDALIDRGRSVRQGLKKMFRMRYLRIPRELYAALDLCVFINKSKNKKNMISLQRVRRRPTGVIQVLVNLTREEINVKEIGNTCYFRVI